MEGVQTTNTLLMVLVAASVLQTLVTIGFVLAARRVFQQRWRTLDEKLTPTLLRLEGVLSNLEHTSAVVRTRTDDMSRAIDTVQHTAGQLGAVLGPRAVVAAGVAGGLLGVVRRWRNRRRDHRNGSVVAG